MGGDWAGFWLMSDGVGCDGAWEGVTGNYSCIRMCIRVYIYVLSHVSHNRRHNPSVFPQTPAPPATRDSAAPSSPGLQPQIEAETEPRAMGDVHARCSSPDGPVFPREGY